MIDGLVCGPDAAKDFDILVGARIAFVMRQEIAILALVGVVAARDDVNGEPPAAEMIERRQLARGQSRRHEARPVRQHQAELLRHKRRIRCDDEAIGGVGEISDQYAIEVRLFMGLREAAHVVDVDRWSAWRMNLRCGLGADHADELDAHGRSPFAPLL